MNLENAFETAPPLAIGRVGPPGNETPVIISEGKAYDARLVTEDITPEFIERGGIEDLAAAARRQELPSANVNAVRIGPPIKHPRKFVCIGLNYHGHAAETGAAIPKEPVVFLKDPGCVVGPNDDVKIPPGSVKTDWEIELAVIVGAEARYLPDPASAAKSIAGYAIVNDLSERELQFERNGGQWDKGKSCEGFAPLGPWLVPAQAVRDPQNLELRLYLNGELRQSSTTSEMIFGVDELVWSLSQFMVLRPGDVISTGTPAGVGMSDGRYLRPGDLLELSITGLGRQCQRVISSDIPLQRTTT